MEQHQGNPLCTGCPHRRDCADLMDDLANRVNVDQVTFHLMPPGYVTRLRAREEDDDPDFCRFESVYTLCHEWVFDSKPAGNLFKYNRLILARAQEASASLKMFLLANMLGWRSTRKEKPIYPQAMIGKAAVRQVKVFAEACHRLYGTFDITALDQLMGSDVGRKDIESHILHSEIVAGSWIVNYKLFHGGSLLQRLYLERETALHPYWLAIEPSYYDQVLRTRHETHDQVSDLIQRHRADTMRVLMTLKRSSLKGIAVFRAREEMMPEAIRRVLGQRGLRAEHFQIDNRPVLSPVKFWSTLGSAIQHYECLKFVDNYQSIFDAHFVRK